MISLSFVPFLGLLTNQLLGFLSTLILLFFLGFYLWSASSDGAPTPELIEPVKPPEEEIPLPTLPAPEKKGSAPVSASV